MCYSTTIISPVPDPALSLLLLLLVLLILRLMLAVSAVATAAAAILRIYATILSAQTCYTCASERSQTNEMTMSTDTTYWNGEDSYTIFILARSIATLLWP